MKITVDRPLEESHQLTFIISVDEPHQIKISEEEIALLKELDECRELSANLPSGGRIKDDINSTLHGLKSLIFEKIIDGLKFSIVNELRVKFDPICQEIYNWIYDFQKGDLKKWLQEFDPQRTKYYFDNDKTIESDVEDEN